MGRGRAALAVVLSAALLIGGPAIRAYADVSNSTGTNVQDGNNNGNTHQGGTSASGDAVGGQVTGVVAAGRTSVDATNVSKDSSVESGEARGSNTSNSFVGLAKSGDSDLLVGSTTDLSFITLNDHANLQDGNNRQTLNQTANATTGDGVAGEVIGVVTAAGGSASVVAANTTTNSDVASGDSRADNESNALVGLANVDEELGVGPSDITNVIGGNDNNIQDGNNRQTASQSATSTSGDGVAGQVIGVVSAGATSVDARNASDNVDVQTGDARTSNVSNAFVGQAFTENDDIEVTLLSDISNIDTTDHLNVQDGNNRQTARQSAAATTGDGVAGEVIGAVTSAGGSASIVAANSSKNSDVTTGDADSANSSSSFVGLGNADEELEVGATDISNVTADNNSNLQDGNNRQTSSQSANASTGDGVAGQVVGVVSAGATSVDANNSSDDVSVETGDSGSSNDSAAIVGLGVTDEDDIEVGPDDVSNVSVDGALNVQDGNNAQTISQSAKATSGDGVAGEVIGGVTSAGGRASIVAANTSRDSDITTGDADSANNSRAFVGLARSDGEILISPTDITNVTSTASSNIQDGTNRQTSSQAATASSGDGVAGQVIGAVSAGATSIDARNVSDDMSVDTGDAGAANSSSAFVGLARTAGSDISIGPADVSNIDTNGNDLNVQDGNNRQTVGQTASAATGDGVGGEVIGVVTSAGGSASVVAANTSRNSDSTTGDANASNDSEAFVGLANAADDVEVGLTDLSNITGQDVNAQDGNNAQTLSQNASASTGDGVAGQTIGVVSAGATSVDANNATTDSSAESGDADASNSNRSFVGLAIAEDDVQLIPADVSGVNAGDQGNIQDGNNRQTLAQSANAMSGDAVSGQVLAGVTAGVITGAGGQVSIVVANTSSSIDSLTGDARFDNDDSAFVGLASAIESTVLE